VKGGHLTEPGKTRDVIDVLAIGKRVVHLPSPRVREAIHGTGCTLASLIAGRLAHAGRINDEIIVEAVRWAKQQLRRTLRHPIRIGPGQLVLSP